MSYKRVFKRIIPIFVLILTLSCQQQPQRQSRYNNLGDTLELREELANPTQSDIDEQTSNSESVKISQEKTEPQSVPEIDEPSPSSLSDPQQEKLIPYDIDTSQMQQEEKIPVEVLDASMIYYYESESDSNGKVVYPRLQTD